MQHIEFYLILLVWIRHPNGARYESRIWILVVTSLNCEILS